eukprot:gb/GEZN01002711.1/.p1 GENE.gb/GEZN01002711.1/~~gb/GEZN01002711.1/.p1  ORF type:complete len:766 (-),score=35.92 gb/GEZN01002711.1/:46-2343(-)
MLCVAILFIVGLIRTAQPQTATPKPKTEQGGLEEHPPSSPQVCINALHASLSSPEIAVEIMNSASSSTWLVASMFGKSPLPVDIGSYDLCEGTPGLMHCVAGSRNNTDVFASPDPISGICVPTACDNVALISPQVSVAVASMVQDARNDMPQGQNDSGGAVPMQKMAYLLKLQDTLSITSEKRLGYTCGEYKYNYTFHNYLFFYLVGSLFFCVFFFSLLHMNMNLTYLSWGLRPLIEAFSLVNVVKYVWKPRGLDQGSFNVLDGLRAVSIFWIILGHTLARQTSVGVMNILVVIPPNGFLANLWAQPFFSSRYAVDTFLFISGLLVSSGLLSFLDPPAHKLRAGAARVKNLHVTTWLPIFYFRRIARILPLYMFCLVLWWQIGVLLGSGPFWYRWSAFIHKCDLYWWTHVLFINNLYPFNSSETDGCFEVSWYLAVDMQLYLLSPFFVLTYLKNKKLGGVLAAFTLMACVIGAGISTYLFQYSAHSFDGEWVTRYSRHLYTKPWFCIIPYLVGMMTAAAWHEKQRLFPRFKFKRARTLLILLLLGFAICVFGSWKAYARRPCSYYEHPGSDQPCGSEWPLWMRVIHIGGSKLCWSSMLGFLTLLSANGQGGVVASFLAHPAWAPVAKLSFAVYLLHALFLNIWYFGRSQKVTYSHFDFSMTYIGITAVSFAAGMMVMALVEIPAHLLLLKVQPASHASLQRIDTKHVMREETYTRLDSDEDEGEDEERLSDEMNGTAEAIPLQLGVQEGYGSKDNYSQPLFSDER